MKTSNSPHQTALYQLAAIKLRRDPLEDIRQRREDGESWRAISFAYLQAGVSVSDVTLRAWHMQAEEQQAAAQ